MPKTPDNLRWFTGVLLPALLLTAFCIGNTEPAAARFGGVGGFARMGGFARPALGARMPRQHVLSRRWSGARIVAHQRPIEPRPHPGIGRPIVRYPIGGRIFYPVVGVNPATPLTPAPSGGGNSISPGTGIGGGNGNNGAGVPPGERRFVPDEVITAFSSNASPQFIDQLARRHGLTQLEARRFPLIATTLYRWRIGGGRSVADTVNTLGGERIVSAVQPNYLFTLQQELARIGAETETAQYALARLQVGAAHRFVSGRNVLVAVIDSEIDARHPDLDAAIAKTFDALGGPADPHEHGTAIAGAIAARGKILGTAPGAQLLAARAFDSTPGQASGTSFAIYKSLQWATDNGARIINMSFAGPADATLHRMLAAASAKNIVLIAAAGNGGPDSGLLYPGADPAVIAVTATDSEDRLFERANRGPHIAIAAPGVDVLALSPGDSYQITTGTSVAAAEISGVAALLLEREPSLTPGDVRAILTDTAKPLGAAGLVNAYRAVTALGGKPVAKGDEQQARQ